MICVWCYLLCVESKSKWNSVGGASIDESIETTQNYVFFNHKTILYVYQEQKSGMEDKYSEYLYLISVLKFSI